MGKIISKYRGYTATQIKSRADVPIQDDMVISGNNVDCKNVSISQVRDVLNAPITSLLALCAHPNVNPWSGFGPTVRSVANQQLINTPPSVGRLGDFAGYNHDAILPGWRGAEPAGDLWVELGDTAEFNADVNVGEIRWSEIGAIGVCHAIYYEDTLVGWVSRNFESLSVQDDATGLIAQVPDIALQRTYTGRIWLVDATDDFDGSQIVCRLPGTVDYERTVKILPLTQVVFDAPEDFTGQAGYSNSPTFGWVRYQNLQCATPYDEVRVYALIWGYQENGIVGDRILLDTYYNWRYDFIESGEGQPNGVWRIPQYGYICRIEVEVVIYGS
jgi:hypothetical protein